MRGEHTIKAFDYDLEDISRAVAELGSIAENGFDHALIALINRDVTLANRLMNIGSHAESLRMEIEGLGVLTIARRQPMAIDLRDVVGALRTSRDLEQIGKLTVHIAKRAMGIKRDFCPPELMQSIDLLGQAVRTNLGEILSSYFGDDVRRALTTRAAKKEIVAEYQSVNEELLSYMQQDAKNIALGNHLTFCAAAIERASDHITNIAETIYYVVEGRPLIEGRQDPGQLAPVVPV